MQDGSEHRMQHGVLRKLSEAVSEMGVWEVSLGQKTVMSKLRSQK